MERYSEALRRAKRSGLAGSLILAALAGCGTANLAPDYGEIRRNLTRSSNMADCAILYRQNHRLEDQQDRIERELARKQREYDNGLHDDGTCPLSSHCPLAEKVSDQCDIVAFVLGTLAKCPDHRGIGSAVTAAVDSVADANSAGIVAKVQQHRAWEPFAFLAVAVATFTALRLSTRKVKHG